MTNAEDIDNVFHVDSEDDFEDVELHTALQQSMDTVPIDDSIIIADEGRADSEDDLGKAIQMSKDGELGVESADDESLQESDQDLEAATALSKDVDSGLSQHATSLTPVEAVFVDDEDEFEDVDLATNPADTSKEPESSRNMAVAFVSDADEEEPNFVEDLQSASNSPGKKPVPQREEPEGRTEFPEYQSFSSAIDSATAQDSAQVIAEESSTFLNYSNQNSLAKTHSIPLEPSPILERQRISFSPDWATSPSSQHDADLAPPINAEPEESDSPMSDDEEAAFLAQLAEEAQEHARFAIQFNPQRAAETEEAFEREIRALRSQQKKDRRDADEVTQLMVLECQELLRQFGIPYIIAPMEAEAQCAELVRLHLVDGVVTDDSDIFLFGGSKVFKNMFNQAKIVECYLTKDLEREFSLDRGKFIELAHLLGSDYTPGIPHIGPVTAVELLAEFNTGSGTSLNEFREWWLSVQKDPRPKAGESNLRRKLRRQAAKLFLPPGFPDHAVDDAYYHPEVDSDPEPFQWGVPDINGLRKYLMNQIGWSEIRVDEVLLPVLRDMNKRLREGGQTNLTDYIGGGSSGVAFAPRKAGVIKSNRLAKALGALKAGDPETNEGNNEGNVDDGADTRSTQPRKRRKARKKANNDLGVVN